MFPGIDINNLFMRTKGVFFIPLRFNCVLRKISNARQLMC